jgi:hypothetical protein
MRQPIVASLAIAFFLTPPLPQGVPRPMPVASATAMLVVFITVVVFDRQAPVLGSTKGFASPIRLRGSTQAGWLMSKERRFGALSIFCNYTGVILLLNMRREHAFCCDPSSGNITTGTYCADTLPACSLALDGRRLAAVR